MREGCRCPFRRYRIRLLSCSFGAVVVVIVPAAAAVAVAVTLRDLELALVLLFSTLASSIIVTIELGDPVLINAIGTTAGTMYVLKLADNVLE